MSDRVLFIVLFLLILWVCLSDRDAMARCQQTHSRDVCHHSLYR